MIIVGTVIIHQTSSTPREKAHRRLLSQSGGPHGVKIPVEWKTGAARSLHLFHPSLYSYVVQAVDPNWFGAHVAPILLCAGLSFL